jgi:hypothetical protein
MVREGDWEVGMTAWPVESLNSNGRSAMRSFNTSSFLLRNSLNTSQPEGSSGAVIQNSSWKVSLGS